MPTRSRKHRLVQNLIGLSILCFVLGVGNIVYGTYKARYYFDLRNKNTVAGYMKKIIAPEVEELDADGSAAGSKSNQDNSLDPVGIKASGDKHTPASLRDEHQRKLTHRLGYYRFSILGGKCLLVLAIVLSLTALHRHLSCGERFSEPDS